ncbi:hypothetical protein CEXT_605421, partial [Caerostris extrusa]
MYSERNSAGHELLIAGQWPLKVWKMLD